MGGNFAIPKSFDYAARYAQFGQQIINQCSQTLQTISDKKYQEKKDEDKEQSSSENETMLFEESNTLPIVKNNFLNLSHPANSAYTNFVRRENNAVNNEKNNSNTALNAGRLVESVETIEEIGKRHLSFLTEGAPESGTISGSINGYYEYGSNKHEAIFLGSIENNWQNKAKTIYTKFKTIIGYHNDDLENEKSKNKFVGNISFNGRLKKNNFVYGAGIEYNSYTDNTNILDINISTKSNIGIGADLTRRTTMTVDETGRKVVSDMKLKVDLLSNKTDDHKDDPSSETFSFDSNSSALPPEAESLSEKAHNFVSSYIKPYRKNGSDIDFDYNENKCGFTYEYNRNLIQKNHQFLSLTPVIGLYDHTDQTVDDNNESLEMTGGLITHYGKTLPNGNFTCSFTGMVNRVVQRSYRPFDSHYVLANAQYHNTKAKFNVVVDAGMLKSGDASMNYANLNAEKEFKNSKLTLSTGAARYKISDDTSNLFNVMATYTYNIPYKTKK